MTCVHLALAGVACANDSSLPPPRTPGGVPGPAGPALHDEAVRELTSAKSTAYTHGITVDEARGVYQYDCSGFVDYAISNVAPNALEALARARVTRRPNARSYVEFLTSLPAGETIRRWKRLDDVSLAQRGDIVAWIAATNHKDPWGIVNTGHVMIVDSLPSERAPGEWVVPVIDSSFGHGGSDTRKWPEVTGIGRGTIVLVVDGGRLVGYRWTEAAKSKVVLTTTVLGRIE